MRLPQRQFSITRYASLSVCPPFRNVAFTASSGSGGGRARSLSVAQRSTDDSFASLPPRLGEHAQAVLGDLGFSEAEIDGIMSAS
jgi:crotonobetainyl-CoA:carnitine CoA-transferase CaiB-like acyl-CoA transferase